MQLPSTVKVGVSLTWDQVYDVQEPFGVKFIGGRVPDVVPNILPELLDIPFPITHYTAAILDETQIQSKKIVSDAQTDPLPLPTLSGTPFAHYTDSAYPHTARKRHLSDVPRDNAADDAYFIDAIEDPAVAIAGEQSFAGGILYKQLCAGGWLLYGISERLREVKEKTDLGNIMGLAGVQVFKCCGFWFWLY
ncbi:hypothetical protein MPER_11883 [Moniliophthora perniciosa FA553]|nr:hypothetical protein MPER_11883 [Moniliophthora perniciosa FA553]